MSKKHKSIIFFILFLFSTILYAQIDKEKKPLSEILTILQNKYNFQFTYADDAIKGIFIEEPSANLTFKEVLTYLRKKTGLILKVLENNFVAIQPRNESLSVCGYIIDYETKLPVENVNIIANNSYTTSDAFGYFKCNIEQENENITIHRLGYYSIVKPFSYFKENDCTNIYILPQIETLSEVVIPNFLTKGIDKIAHGAFTINFSNFGILPGLIETDVLQTVQALPGIQSVNETVSNINIRGGTHDQNLLLWDGIKMYQSGHFFGLISIFNPSITTDVSVIKNGTSVDLSDGVSGTIAMKTASNIKNSFSGSIGANLINVDAFLDVPISEKSSVQISARNALSNMVETPTYTEYFNRILSNTEVIHPTTKVENTNIKFEFYDTSLRWLYAISEKDQLRLNFLNVYNELEFDEIAKVNNVQQSKKSNLEQNSISGGIFYQRKWNSKFVSTLQIYETDYTLKAINSDILNQQRLLQENIVSETSLKLNTWYKYNTNISFLNGYQVTETGVSNLTDVDNPVFKEFIREVIREHALYSQINYQSTSNKTSVRAGIRYNYVEKFKKHIIEPRLSLHHKFLDNFSLDISGELKHQNTSQIINFQNDFLGIEKRRWVLSDNDKIPILISQQASIGLNYSHQGWLISAEGYLKEVDGITSQSQGFLNQYISKKENGSYRVKGIELLINKRFRKISTWLSYTYANNEYTFKNFEEINFANNLDIKHSFTLGSSFSTKKIKISAGMNWHSGIPSTNLVNGNEIVNNTLQYESANSSRVKEYFRLDVSAIYKFSFSEKVNAILGASLWNSTSRKNLLNDYYRLDIDNHPLEIKQTSLGLTPNFTFRVEFR
ncbi:MAG TPA: TonB-dependent receptor [Flavobacteriia bacterium]|nr:TonB-dependent receptor [Flavobacteriia bacterium]